MNFNKSYANKISIANFQVTNRSFWKYALPLLILALAPLGISAQSILRGQVLDENKDGAIAAYVAIEGTETKTITNLDGNYILTLPDGTADKVTIIVSYLGYSTQTVEVTLNSSETIMNFQLVEDAFKLRSVVVSARKKEELSQNVPMSISAIPLEDLRRNGALGFRDYAASVPNLSFGTKGGGGAFRDGRMSNQITIRGISGIGTTAFYLDETPLPETVDPKLLDAARVEVLRGPQGTLYGSSTMGGAVKVVTNTPNLYKIEGSVDVSAGAVKEGDLDYNVQGVLNLPIVKEKLGLRVAGFYDFESGIFDRYKMTEWSVTDEDGNVLTAPLVQYDNGNAAQDAPIKENVDSEHNYGFHASLGYYPKEGFSIVPTFIYQNTHGNGYDFADGMPGNFQQNRVAGTDESFDDAWWHTGLNMKFDLDKGTLISSTSFTDRAYQDNEDLSDRQSFNVMNNMTLGGAPQAFFFAENMVRDGEFKKFVQEVRFLSDFGKKVDFVLGGFYSNDNLHEYNTKYRDSFYVFIELPDQLRDLPFWKFDNDVTTQEIAFFGELYYKITPQLTATAGLRYYNYNRDRQYTAEGLVVDFETLVTDAKITGQGFNPKFNLSYRIKEDKLIYATISRGFRLGGINDVVPTYFCEDDLATLPGGQAPADFDSDALWNYELGAKTAWADGRFTANAAVFYNQWNNLQQFALLPCGFGFQSNVGKAVSKGLDLELRAKVIKGLNVGVGIGLLDAKITEADSILDAEVGDRILFTPQFTANANAQYSFDIDDKSSMYIRAELQHSGERTSSFEQATLENGDANPMHDPARVFPSYTIINSRIGYISGPIEAALFVNNLTNTAANYGDLISLGSEVPGRPRYSTNRPISFGVNLRYQF